MLVSLHKTELQQVESIDINSECVLTSLIHFYIL